MRDAREKISIAIASRSSRDRAPARTSLSYNRYNPIHLPRHLGRGADRRSVLSDAHWPTAAVFYVCLPAKSRRREGAEGRRERGGNLGKFLIPNRFILIQPRQI